MRTGCRHSALAAPCRCSEGARSEREEEWESGLGFALGADAAAVGLGCWAVRDLWAGGGVGGEMGI